MKFLLLTLIAHHPDPVSRDKKSAADRLRDVAPVLRKQIPSRPLAAQSGRKEVVL